MVDVRIEHDPALTIERIEPRGFVMNRRNDGGYRLKSIMGGEPVVLLVPDAEAPLAIELARALVAGYLRGTDLWHIATALYIAPRAEKIGFITLDGPQREVAAALGFQVGTGWPIVDSG